MTENVQETSQHVDSTQRQDEVITVVLTADNHLGYAAFGQQPRKREERQRRLRYAFQQAADFAVGQGVDLFIQAGDLFDTSNPDERDRSFVAERLARLKQAGVRAFAVGGMHDTPGNMLSAGSETTPAPQISYANLGALHYLPPIQKGEPVEPTLVNIHGVLVGICGVSVTSGQEGDPLARLRVSYEIERATIAILILHAPIEGWGGGNSSLLESRFQVNRSSIARQFDFHYILAGYHHSYSRSRIGQTEIVVAGSTQHVDFSTHDSAPGFVFLGLAADGIRWCNHIPVDTLQLRRLSIHTDELWPSSDQETRIAEHDPTEHILEQLRPLCDAETMVQLCLEGEVTRRQYHELDLNSIRRYGEEHCFALAIDDSALSLLPDQEGSITEVGERFSPREELTLIADEWIAAANDEYEKKALRATKEELLRTLDDVRGKY